MASSGKFPIVLYKPQFEKGGGGILVSQSYGPRAVKVVTPDGKTFTQTKGTTGHEGDALKFKLGNVGSYPPGTKIIIETANGDFEMTPQNMALRHEYQFGNSQPTKVGGKGSGSGSGIAQNSPYAPGSNPVQNSADAKNFVANPQYIDPSNYSDLNYPKIPNREITEEDILATVRKNFGLQKESNDFALGETNRIYPQVQDTVETAIGRRNEFSQEQLDKAYNKFPQIQKAVTEQFKDAGVFKEGKIPDAVLNRRLTNNINSSASDAARYLGGGIDSGFASKTNDLLSAEEALKLRDKGDALENTAIANAEKLISKPQDYTADPEKYLADFRKSTNVSATETLGELSKNRDLNSEIDTKNVANNIDQQKYNLEKNIGIDMFNQGQNQSYQQSVNNLYLQSLQNQYQNAEQQKLIDQIKNNQTLSMFTQLGLAAANKNSGISQVLNSIFGGNKDNNSFGNLWEWVKGIGSSLGSQESSGGNLPSFPSSSGLTPTVPSNSSGLTPPTLSSDFGKFNL